MDLYALLGVTRAASADEIGRAYRRLARRYHPGVNPGDARAAATYDEIEQAFSVLGNSDRRREYDRGAIAPAGEVVAASVAFQGFDFSALAQGAQAATFSELFADVFQAAARRATTPEAPLDIALTLSLAFEDAIRGGHFPLSVLRQERCASCGGGGRLLRSAAPCPQCHGEGTLRWARGHMVFTKTCDACDGSGRLTSQSCRSCSGAGVIERSEVVHVTLPPGVEPGVRVVVPGRGHASPMHGPAGDLYVTVDVAEHPFFRRRGRDLFVTLPIAVHEAALGARVDVPTLGEPVRLRIPAGTSSGRQLRIAGHGVPASPGRDPSEAGDLVVDVQIVLPPLRDERSRRLMKEFGQLNGGDVRQRLFEGRRCGNLDAAISKGKPL